MSFCKSAGMIPRKQIVIQKLLAKFPQWGIACVDGVLVDWDFCDVYDGLFGVAELWPPISD
ncbi:MAG: hypothetical protein ACYTXT_28720 [Nostoc sp.]